MEQQLLFLLDFDLRFDEGAAIEHWLQFLPPRSSSPQQDRETRQSAINRLKAGRVNLYNSQLPLTPPHDEVTPSMTKSQSSSASLSVPCSDSRKDFHRRSPALSNLSPFSSDDASCTESGSSTCSMTDYCSSGTESDIEEETRSNKASSGYFPLARQLAKETSASSGGTSSSSSCAKLPRVSFALPLRPAPARSSSGRSSSVHLSSLHHRRSYQCDAGAGTTLRTSSTLPSIPRIRESVSSGFLSRVFGGGHRDKADRVEKGNGGTCVNTLDSTYDDDLEASRSAGKALRESVRTQQRLRYTYNDGMEVIPL